MNGDSPAREPNSTSAATNALCSCKRPRRQVAAPGAHKRRHRLQQHAASRAVHRVHHLPRSKTSRSPALYTVKPLFVAALFEILSATEKHPRAATLVASRGGSTNDPVRSRNSGSGTRPEERGGVPVADSLFVASITPRARARINAPERVYADSSFSREERRVRPQHLRPNRIGGDAGGAGHCARARRGGTRRRGANEKKGTRHTFFFSARVVCIREGSVPRVTGEESHAASVLR